MNSIKDGFIEYKDRVIPENAPEVQVAETEKAFYAGAMIMYRLFVSAGNETEEACHALWNSYQEEIREFAEGVLIEESKNG